MILRLSILVLALLILAGYEELRETFTGPAISVDRYQALRTYMVHDPKGNQMHVTYVPPKRVFLWPSPLVFGHGRAFLCACVNQKIGHSSAARPLLSKRRDLGTVVSLLAVV
jgi:hypothetical protein